MNRFVYYFGMVIAVIGVVIGLLSTIFSFGSDWTTLLLSTILLVIIVAAENNAK